MSELPPPPPDKTGWAWTEESPQLPDARRGGSKRVSDRLRSYEGRTFRIYALGFRSTASGWPDLGKRCGEIAASLTGELDAKGKLRKLAWQGGWLGAFIWLLGS